VLEINGQKPRGVLVEQRAPVAHEYFAAVTWDGRRKLPVLIFSDMGGIDIEEVAEKHPEHVSRVHLSSLLPFSPYKAKEAIAATGVTGDDLTRLTPIVATLAEIFLRYDLTLAEINPLGKTADGKFLVLDGHVDLESDARDKHAKAVAELGIGKEETREARPPTELEIRGALVDASDHRGARGQADQLLRDRRQPQRQKSVRADEAHSLQARREEDRRDDERRLEHPRRHRRPWRHQGLRRIGARPGADDRDFPHPGRMGGRRL